MQAKTRPNAAQINDIVADRLAALDEHKDAQETVSIEWRGTTIHVPVISMPVDLVAYNPDTHRIRAQRTVDAYGSKALEDDPWGSEAQSYLHRLLMGDPADPSKIDPSFVALKEDLDEHGQNEPGIITRAGVLINGNTRRAALKELGSEHIRVGVLPRDAGAEDIQGIELSLQLRKEHRRDYSFMNFLLAIDEQVHEGRPAALIQKSFRMKAAVFDRSQWILGFVKDAIKRSRVITGNGEVANLNLVDFESHQGKLEELYKAFVTAAKQSPDEAKALCEQRLVAILLNKAKTDLRLIEPDFAEKYMKHLLPKPADAPVLGIPGTSITVPADAANVRSLQQLADSALQAKAIINAGQRVAPHDADAASKIMIQLDTSVDKALDYAGKQARLQKRKIAAADRISDACEDLDLAVEEVARARAVSQFAAEDVDDALLSLKKSLEKLGAIVSRGQESGYDGVKWLAALASLQDPQRHQ
jgi:hypothetical protein